MITTIFKVAIGTTAQIGTGIMIDQAAKMLIPKDAGKAVKICCCVGETMVGTMVGMAVQNCADQLVDECVELGRVIIGKGNKEEKK